MPTWPLALPQTLRQDVPVTPLDGRIRTPVDSGLPTVRRRFTVDLAEIGPVRMTLSGVQRQVLEEFGRVTLQGWVQTFDWPDPWPGAGTLAVRFKERPTYPETTRGGPLADQSWAAEFRLEQVE